MRLGGAARRALFVAVPFLLAVVLFAPATLGGRVLSASDLPLSMAPFPQPPAVAPKNLLQFDSGHIFEPDGLEVRRALRDWRLPIWTPWQSAGRPLLAAQQSAPLFPLTWLSALLPFWESLAWIAVLGLTLAGLGTALLARALGLRRGPALLAACAFAFGMYLIAWLMHPHTNAYVLLPWLLLAGERVCRSGSVRDAGLLGIGIGVAWLGGQPESAMLVSLTAAAWIGHRLHAAAPGRRDMLRRAALAGGAGLAGLAVAAVMLLPFFEALGEAGDASRARPPLPLSAAITLVAPEYWGRPDRVEVIAGPVNFTERALYVGVLPLLLAIAGLAASRPRGPRLFFALLTAVALVVSLDTGPVASLAAKIPLLREMNITRALVLASFGLALLAAFGLQQLLEGGAAVRRRMLVAAGVAGALPPLVLVAMHPGWLGDLGAAARPFRGKSLPVAADPVAFASVLRWSLLAAITVALLAGLTVTRRRRALLAAGAVAVAAADLIVMGWGYNPAITKAQADPPEPPAVGVMRRLTADGGRVAGFGAMEPNNAARWRLPDATGHEQPAVNRSQNLWSALGGWGYGTPPAAQLDERAPHALDVFGVRAVLLAPPAQRAPEPPIPAPLAGRPVAYSGPGGVVVENPSALPPAFVAYGWRPSRNGLEAIFLTAARTAREARDEPAIETAAAPPPGPPPPATPARVITRDDTSVTVEVRARRAGRLVLLDTFYPGWRAEVDGRPVTIEAANAAFRAVAVPAGRHTVRFTYRPTSVLAGGVISLVSLAGLAACVLLGGGRRRAGGVRQVRLRRTQRA